MKRRHLLATNQVSLKILDDLLLDGWNMDKTYVLDSGAIFSLTLAEEDDVAEEKLGEFGDVVDVKAVEFDGVQDMISQGYVVQSIYAKNCILIKRKALLT